MPFCTAPPVRLREAAQLNADYRGSGFTAVPAAADLFLDVDPQLFRSAVILLNNAFTFTRAGGHVVLRALAADDRLRRCNAVPHGTALSCLALLAWSQEYDMANEPRSPDPLGDAHAEGLRARAEIGRQDAERDRDLTEEQRLSAESGRNEAERFRRLAEEARALRDQQRQALELVRQERESLREAGEAARLAAEEARSAADAARHAAVDAVKATADSLQVALESMKTVEEMRRTLRTVRDLNKLDSN